MQILKVFSCVDFEAENAPINNKIRTKITPTNENYKRTVNIGFFNNSDKCTIYSCFIDNCRFKTRSIENFQKHLNNFHENDKKIQQNFCSICGNFQCGFSLDEELQHMVEHIKEPEKSKLNLDETVIVNNDYNGERMSDEENDFEIQSYENPIQIDFQKSPLRSKKIKKPAKLTFEDEKIQRKRERSEDLLEILPKKKLRKIENEKNKGVKKFKCTHCDYSAKTKGNLTKHLIIHDPNRVKAHKCTYCNYSSDHLGILNRHLNQRH